MEPWLWFTAQRELGVCRQQFGEPHQSFYLYFDKHSQEVIQICQQCTYVEVMLSFLWPAWPLLCSLLDGRTTKSVSASRGSPGGGGAGSTPNMRDTTAWLASLSANFLTRLSSFTSG